MKLVLKPENRKQFSKLSYNRLKCYLRRDVFEHMLNNEEKDCFYLDEFIKRVNNEEKMTKIVDEIIPELETLGWKCKKSFGNTGLFIYSTENPPASCLEYIS